MPPRDPFFPKSPAVLQAEHQLGMDLTTAPGKLSDLVTLEDLRREEALTTLITARVVNALRREHGIDLRTEEPETKATATPMPVRDQTIRPTDPPQTFQSLATEVRERV